MRHLHIQIQSILPNTLPGCVKLLFIITLVVTCHFYVYSQSPSEYRYKVNDGTNIQKLEASWELFKFYRVSDKDSALYFARINNEVAIELKDTLSIVKSFNALGYLNKEEANYSDAILNYEKGLELAKVQDYGDQVKFLLNNLALVHTYFGNYDESLNYHFQSLKIRETEEDLAGMAVAYNNIGLVYYQIADDEKALNYFLKSLNLEREIYGRGSDESLINLGLVYTSLMKFQEALTAYNEVLDRCISIDCPKQIQLKANSGSGIAFIGMSNLDEAKDRFLKAKSLANDLNDKISFVIANYYLSRIHFENEQYVKSLNFLNEASAVAENTDAKTWKMEIDNLYADLYSAQGDFEKAYFHESRYSTLKDSIFNEELIKNLANIQLDYQEQQTQEIIEGKNYQIRRRDQINLLLGGVTLLITALLVILYKSNQFRKKTNKKLAEANDIIEEQNKELTNVNAVLEERVKERTKELKEANIALKKSNEELDNFIYKTSHDIRGPLATLMGVCNIAQMDVKDKQALDYFEKLGITANRLNEILSKLLIINQINNSAIKPERVALGSFVNELIEEQKLNFTKAKVKLNLELNSNITISTDKELIRVIYSNLINNAFKFRDNSERVDSFIAVKLAKENGHILFTVEDNGIGIDLNESERIFEVFSKASDLADSSGIGLYLVKLAVEKLNGSIQQTTTAEGYTRFVVKLPS